VQSVIKTLLLATALGVILLGCSHAESPVGLWQSDPVQWDNPTGHANKLDGYYKIEFLRDGSFKLACVITGNGRQFGLFPWELSGKFQIINADHIKMEVSKTPWPTTGASPVTNTYSISGDNLELQGLSDITKTTTYHRVKQ
jgi:hypothetical protein